MNLLKKSFVLAACVLCLSGASVLANSITIETPLPGSVIKAGNVCNVTWAWEGTFPSVNIDLSTDDGATWRPLAMYYDNKGSFTCFIPYFTAPQCKIRIGDVDGSAEDISGTFSLLAGTLSVSVPKIDSFNTPIFYGQEVTVPVWLANTGEALVLLNSAIVTKSIPIDADWLGTALELPAFIRPGDSLLFSITLNKGGVFLTDQSLKGLVRLDFNSSTQTSDIAIDTKVRSSNRAPYFIGVKDVQVYESDPVTVAVLTKDPDNQIPSLSAINIPAGATFTDNHDGSGLLQWQTSFSESGFHVVQFVASDGTLADTATVTIHVYNFNRVPRFDPIAHQFAAALHTLHFDISASDADNDSIWFEVVPALPPNCSTVDHGNGTITFTFTPIESQIGEAGFIIAVHDGQSASLENVWITIEPASPVSITSCGACAPTSPGGDILTTDPIIIVFSHVIQESSLASHVAVVSRRDGVLSYTYDATGRAIRVTPKYDDLSQLDTIGVTITAGLASYTDAVLPADYHAEIHTGPIIYPGDLNNDGVIDERDIFPIGLYFGQTGPARERYDAGDHPRPEPAHRWATLAASYADANGSGKVDMDDICYITKYFGWHLGDATPGSRQPLDLATAGIDANRKGLMLEALSGCPPSFGTSALLGALGGEIETPEVALPKTTELFANYPNPFNPSTTISYQLEKPGHVRLTIFNVMGQTVRSLINDQREAGNGQIEWNGTDDDGTTVASGIYFYRLETSNFAKTRSLLLLK